MKVLSIFGTRPEAIKLAPVIHELDRRGHKDQIICVTGQHKEMLHQMLELFYIAPHHDMSVMTANQSLEQITSKILSGLDAILDKEKPDLVLVQGDTTTALMGALAAFYKKIPVGHVEAGLRTDNKYNPFPEEINRRLISQLADLHFTPTERATDNLLASGIKPDAIHLTGNTVIDALLWVADKKLPFADKNLEDFDFSKKVILVTTHRRENLGEGLSSIFRAIKKLSDEYRGQVSFVFPVHLNPKVREQVQAELTGASNVLLLEPLSYSDLVNVMTKCYLIMTDSGGIQEEGPALGKPVLVLRETTERPEGIEAGTARLVGTDETKIYQAAKDLLDDKSAYQQIANAVNPYGDGSAARQIADILENI